MKARTVGVVAFAVMALALVGAAVGVMAAGGGDQEPASKPRAAGAQQVVDAIGAKWPLPNPRDTTSGCKAKEGDSAKGCESRVTTDAVTVVAFADEGTAARWATELGKAGDTRQAGRYVLSWTAREQDMTSDEARADMVAIAKGL
ncbi:hypothetical protein [Micromonospora sp. WMMC250]|uniref:hypothetical protein n=1 Tax=Micromonospora sp. WMMC250 TaxID=3014781 RepID=UPI0022B678E3|nr:hypothetical protein [Micromonospora sp. WMMC250]MCZ7376539.1 hypothetical protein [Micromonospora sp. WMMC250]